MSTDLEIFRMTPSDKLASAMERALPLLPADARSAVQALLTPESLALISGTLVAWAGSHLFGVGEVVDVLMLGVGAITLGFSVFEGGTCVYNFTTVALRARSETELNEAARHFARAVTLLGISAVQAVLLHGQGRAMLTRGRPQLQGRIRLSAPPPPGNQLRLTRPASIANGALGGSDAYGVITISRDQSLTEQRITLFHELVHRYFSPRTGPMRQLRAELRLAAYSRSAIVRYLEEVLAEGYGQLRVHGLAHAIQSLRFPLRGGYVTIAQLVSEGHAIGTISLGGAQFRVSISQGSIPSNP